MATKRRRNDDKATTAATAVATMAGGDRSVASDHSNVDLPVASDAAGDVASGASGTDHTTAIDGETIKARLRAILDTPLNQRVPSCARCKGSGKDDPLDRSKTPKTCRECEGTGRPVAQG